WDESWGGWTNFAPFALDWEGRAGGLISPELEADEVLCNGRWQAPELKVDQLVARLYDGKLDAGASLNVATRVLNFSAASDFDVQKAAPVLTPRARDWLAQFSWQKAPQ